MPTFTVNYNLRKPAGGDLVTVAQDINASMDIIDAALKSHADSLEAISELQDADVLILKTSDQSIASSTSIVNDSELLYAFTSTGKYIMNGVLLVGGGDTGDININVSWTGAISLSGRLVGPPTTATSLTEQTRMQTAQQVSSSPWAIGGGIGTVSGQIIAIKLDFIMDVTSTGTVRIKWAQNTSNGTATVMKAGSFLNIRKVAS